MTKSDHLFLNDTLYHWKKKKFQFETHDGDTRTGMYPRPPQPNFFE